jgi:ABC-type branched-subunit amino acid transport system substrate-binding protein/ABC-type sugar transport system substrate-binding protein
MKTKLLSLFLILSVLGTLIAGCTTTPQATQAPTIEKTQPVEQAQPTKEAVSGSLEGKKVCYLIPESGNAFLSGLTEGVKEKFAADGVEVMIFGAEGNATTQYNQIENCISQGVAGMIVMAAIEPEGVASAVLEAKKAGIKVMGVPVDQQGPYDAIMHTDQYEIGTTMAGMACDWINATYPDAADDSVEVAVIGTKGTENIKKRTEGMETIDACAKAKLVQFVDVPETTISEAVSATENIFTANPNVKVVLVVGDSGAQGVAQAMAAYAPNNLDEYAVFSGDVSPDTQEKLPKCEAGAYRGAVAIGGSLDDLMQSTYEIMKGMISGGDYPAETLDPLTTFRCEATAAATGEEAAKPPAPEFIELGGSIPLTGNFGSLGNMVLPGYENAVADINADGGIYVEEYGKKIPVRLTVYDDESDPTKAVSKLETLYSDQNVVAYLGGAGSSMHAAASAIAEKNQVPYCGIAFALYKIHQQGYKYLFSPFPKSPQQAKDTFEILNAAIPEGERPTKVAIFSYSDDWGKELGDLWEKYAAENGYEVVVRAENPVGVNEWSDAILKAKAAGAEVLLSLPVFPDGSGMFKTMAELGWTPKFSLVIRAPEGVNWGESMGKIGDYVTIFPGWHNAEKFPGVDKLNEAYQAEFGRPADLLTGPAYACVQIIAAAIENAGTLDRAAIRDAMAATDMETVIGPVTFNEDGTGNVLNPLVQWQNGQLELVWPPDQASADFQYPAPPFEDR